MMKNDDANNHIICNDDMLIANYSKKKKTKENGKMAAMLCPNRDRAKSLW